jgi:hypothetical protein
MEASMTMFWMRQIAGFSSGCLWRCRCQFGEPGSGACSGVARRLTAFQRDTIKSSGE